MDEIMASLPKLNEKYSMFSCITDDLETKGFRFLFSAKDNLTSKDMETRCGSRILEGYRPVFDATAIDRMRKAGGKLIGKNSMDEFGFGTFSTNSAFGVPKNPFDPERSCGGSSGGSACAAALIDGHISLGVSTGGSICCPASFCGVYGIAPTYGRVSRYGLIDYGNSLDKIGLISSDPNKLTEFLPVISGKDPKDPTSCAQPEPGPKGRKIRSAAVPKEALESISKDVRSSFESSLETLKSMGVDVKLTEMPFLKYAMPAYYVLASSEASTNLARYVGMRYGRQDGDLTLKFDDYFASFRSEYFGDEAKRRILLGTYARMAGFRDRYYAKALKVRLHVISSYKKVFAGCDAVLTPTMPFAAPRFDEISKMAPVESYSADYLTVPPNLAGMPQLSVPCGYDGGGMPIGMQLVTDHWAEDPLLTFAADWESVFETRRPEVSP
ncbi:MAG: Asp-tRNA(Asn)/Glu-tRNA(Gln) amidotransferase subunit GatA [Candidatus Methanoplasma sp.]|jgi:aspartyl-tRNA(Asn)/glutamyl-tRNA(Gln) amidotransferase subunit A|nr:Asp-tRNA(Asn)/Glu-tRNA(Gln) amidotransferase subunit GatA [Candidatus Methanoplasma sp.]